MICRPAVSWIRCLLLSVLAGCGVACTTTQIIPPRAVQDPAPVYVLEHNWTSSLVLSAADGSLYRYAYGDWAYYAERQTGSSSGLAALLWPTPAGLGRRQLSGPPTAASVYRQVRVGIDRLHSITVEQDKVNGLRMQLDALFDASATQHASPGVDLVFVPYPVDYQLTHNSNHMVADWLMQLGCQVDDRPVLSGWRVMQDE